MNPLLSLLITSAGAAAGAVGKALWDQLMARQEELSRIRRDKKIQLLERQLSEFYWPIYIRLEKDNLIWEKVFDQNSGVDPAVQKTLETTHILPNHQEVMEILSNKIHLARAREPLAKALSDYIRHIAVYQAIRQAGIHDRDPLQFGEPYPTEIFKLIESEKNRLQAEYDRLLGFV
ncbi:MAG: hypothetical protein ACFB16_20445 [Phormidesmis sp.]